MTVDDAPETSRSRADRLRIAVLATNPAELGQALRRMPKHLSEAIAKQVGVPAPVLRRDPAPARFLRRTDAAPVFSTVADVLTGDCLDATIAVLGRAADDPTLNQLRAAVDAVAEEHPHPTVALMLVATAASGAAAAEACEQILADDERFAVPDEVPDEVLVAGPVGSTPSPAAPAGPGAGDDAAREERKARKAARRAEERARQQRAREAAELRRKDRKKGRAGGGASETASSPAPATEPTPTAGGAPAGPARRAPALAPREAAAFDAGHPLVGQVVVAEIAFDGEDPNHPELTSKRRPAVVVGVAEEELLVRPGYSEGGLKARTWQSVPLEHWRDAGLHAPTWIERDTRRVARTEASAPVGQLSTTDWNALW